MPKQSIERLLFRAIPCGAVLCALLPFTGCGSSPSSGGGSGSSGDVLTSGGATSVFVVQQTAVGSNSILQFPAGASGTISPSATISLSGITVYAFATDSTGKLYVGASLTSGLAELLVYAAGSNGTPTAIQTITGTASSFNEIEAITVDSAGLIYVAGYGSTGMAIFVYAANASGAATPLRTITGALTALYSITAIALDSSSNLYVASNSGTGTTPILAFPSTASGNVAPSRTIATSGFVFGMATDTSGDLYATVTTETTSSSTAVIEEFGPTASGSATPLKTIAGTATDLILAGGLGRDSVGNLYTVDVTAENSTTGTATVSVATYGPSASGNVAPATQMFSSSWNAPGQQLSVK